MSRRATARRVAHTRAWVADVVRSGLWPDAEVLRQVTDAIAHDHPRLPAGETALAWIAAAQQDWRAEAAAWPERTDHDRLEDAFARLERRGVVVLRGCLDHWAARERLAGAGGARGIAWFTPPDVWHAIGDGMLEVNLWHADTANVAAGDDLLEETIDAFESVGLPARFDEGRVEVAAFWQLRPVDR